MSPNLHDPGMRSLAQQLLACEASAHISSGAKGPPVIRVSETLRHSLSTLAGGSGFRALLARALTLAKAQIPSLSAVQVEPDGSLEGLSQLGHEEAEQAGIVLTAQLLGLLSNFIGESLMLRLLLEKWPDLLGDGDTNASPKEESPQ